MSVPGYAIVVTAVLTLLACSGIPGAPAPAPTATPRPTPSPVPTVGPMAVRSPASVVFRPVPTPSPTPTRTPSPITRFAPTPVLPDPTVTAIELRCYYSGTGIPDDLMAPLAEIVDKHTTRTVVTDRGTFRIEVGCFVDIHRWLLDDAHNPIPTPTSTAWSPVLMNHPFLTHDYVNLPPTPPVVVMRKDKWEFTLYGLMDVHAYHGGGKWVLRAEATMDVETCEAKVERVVAGPDEIVLYPEDGA